QTSELSRTHRERLARNGFITPVMRGWWMLSNPEAEPGDTTAWYASFWEFCARYATLRFGQDWHLSPDLSLLRHAEATAIPRQVILHTPSGTNNQIGLPFGTSIFDYRTPPSDFAHVVVRDGLRLLTPAVALVRVPASFFQRPPLEAEIVLARVGDVGELLRVLLAGDHSTVAGRLAGALAHVGRAHDAREVVHTMVEVGHDVRVTDPFSPGHATVPVPQARSPVVARLTRLWASMRGPLLDLIPAPPDGPLDPGAYLRSVDGVYAQDAYHSLSIEGYFVTQELIERVREGRWDPERNEADRAGRDALAARGYWLAFQEVRGAVERILGEPSRAADIVQQGHRDWYRALFQPAVTAGVLEASELAGYRGHAVYIRKSRHVPPRSETVGDAMTALFRLIAEEEEHAVRAVLGHWMLGYIHPFPDGNGRIARFLMNALLAAGRYPWVVVRTDERDLYMDALERASTEHDIGPFAAFLGERMRLAMGGVARGMVPGR
ncbi:MAG: Fic family protein, partial [Gemmatimonadetes bacterium]|nr:Fic family protein [Gemmatimonadota bacterium]